LDIYINDLKFLEDVSLADLTYEEIKKIGDQIVSVVNKKNKALEEEKKN
jgi:hypothetical protein